MTFQYPDSDWKVLAKINLTIRPGEHIALVGENGAGKIVESGTHDELLYHGGKYAACPVLQRNAHTQRSCGFMLGERRDTPEPSTDRSIVEPSSSTGPAHDPPMRPTNEFVPFSEEDIEQSIPERFEKIVDKYPDRLAVKAGDRALTYDALNQLVNRIARVILAKRGEDSEPVALLFEHGIDAIAAIFGTLKASKFYVALDPSFPRERITYILEDSQAGLIVTNNRNVDLAHKLTNDRRALLNIDEIDDSFSCVNPGLSLSPDDFVHIMYTSGSTGSPKGVVHTHRAVLQNTMVNTNKMHICTRDRLALLHPISFGSSKLGLFASLLGGASLLTVNVKSERISQLARWLNDEQITIYLLPPAVFRQLADVLAGTEKPSSLRLIHLTGAPITQRDIDLYKTLFLPGTLLEIAMGSTEANMVCSYTVSPGFTFPEDGVPIGHPLPGKKVLLFDENDHEIGPNQVGEIAVKSRYVAVGYWRQPQLTRAKFLPDPTGGDERIYLTGDLGRMMPDGFLIHLGRKDSQVKIRGYRVEITEIEQALLAHPQVKEAGVVTWERKPGEHQLVAYVVPRENLTPKVVELRRFLKDKLPDYMLPSAFMFLEALPLTNGKLDRKALPDPDDKRPETDTPYVPAQCEVEQKLVAIWEEILDVRPIGIHDNFFDLGGHSLAAASLISKLQKEFDIDLTIGALVKTPTIEELARQIETERDKRQNREWSYLVQLQPGDGRKPIFFLPGGIGGDSEFFVYARLARHVGSDYPFYGLKARSAQGTEPSQASVEQMASDYLKEIRFLQPQGPYYIVGECLGGIIAYEMARQLQEQGHKIALLALMDTPRPDLSLEIRRRLGRLCRSILESHYVRGLIFLREQMRQRSVKEKIRYLFNKRSRIVVQLTLVPQILSSPKTGRGVEYVQRSYSRAIYRYRPRPYSGKMALLVHEESCPDDPTMGWKDFLTGGVEIHHLPGDHTTYIRDHVQPAAEQLKKCIEAAETKVN